MRSDPRPNGDTLEDSLLLLHLCLDLGHVRCQQREPSLQLDPVHLHHGMQPFRPVRCLYDLLCAQPQDH